ncbi:hypothetical protein ACN28I_29210 [Archangium gephyra]|uniref:hypothetical protein n=1 Tax=Archangium gephyra TaxID=48 RepID=UPI003B7E6BC2
MRNPAVWLALTGTVTGLLGFWAGRASVPTPEADDALRQLVLAHDAQLAALRSQPPPPPQGTCTTVATLSANDSASLRAELARLVREELHPEPRAPSAEPPPELPRAETPAPEQLPLIQDTQRLVDSALSARRWTDQDAEAFRRLAPHLPDAQRRALMQQVVVAINEGRIQMETRGLPF